MSRTHTIDLRLTLAILLVGLSFLMSMKWMQLPYVHYMVLLLGAILLTPKTSHAGRPRSHWYAFFTVAVLLSLSWIQEAWRARTGTEFVDTLWWKIPVHLWILGVVLHEASKAIRSARSASATSALA